MSSTLDRPVKLPAYAFLGLLFAGMGLALANRTGLLDAATLKRGLGLMVALMAVVVGNFLPKIRLLSGDPLRTAAAERFAGWALVLTGLADVALFLFAPLETARLCSGVLGISAMAVIALSWAGLLFARRQEGPATGSKRIMASLLLAFFYVFANACAVFVAEDPRVREIITWANVGFSVVFVALYSAINRRPRAPMTE